jgi:putative tryptophan/tyrosine transport system substrate-binding protein
VQEATTTIPIIAVVAGFREINAARPGGNVTGFEGSYGFAGKWVELLKEAAPRVERIGVVFSGGFATYQPSIAAAAQALSVPLVSMPFRDAAELERAASAFAAKPNGGLVLMPSVATM